MAVRIKHTFRGINSDIHPNLLSSGTADQAINVLVTGGTLSKRAGFAELEDDATGTHAGIASAFVAKYSDESVYLVVKVADGTLWHRKMSATAATAFTQVSLAGLDYASDKHSTVDPGWWFFWADRLYHIDRVGVTKMHIPSATVWKGGLCQPTYGPSLVAAAGGQKDGRYHVCCSYRNSKTTEEGIVTTFAPGSGGALKCDLSDDKGGIAISNWTTHLNAIAATNSDVRKYEWDRVVFYCTMGSTEYIGRGIGYECFSYRAYVDVVKTANHAGTGSAGMNKADHVLSSEEQFTNAGGLPPGSRLGCFNGQRTLFANVHSAAATLIPGQLWQSIPGKPTMVPRPYTYTTTNDSKIFFPKPWDGTIYSGLDGLPSACAFGGGAMAVFTKTSTYTMQASGSGRLFPVLRHGSKGAVASGAAVGTPVGVHAVGHKSWLTVGSESWRDLATDRFAGLLGEIPVAYEGKTVMGYYGHADQVWAAVVKTGEAIAQRILVWDASAAGGDGAMTCFDPACLGVSEGITALVELAVPSTDPVMLVCTSTGRVLQYPIGDDDNGTDYAASWRGYFGTERRVFDQALGRIVIRSGANVAGNVTVGVRCFRSSDETITQETMTLSKSDAMEPIVGEFSYLDASLYQLEFSSAESVSTRWAINDLVLTLERTDKA